MIEFDRTRYRVTRQGTVESWRVDDTWQPLTTYCAAGNGYPTVQLWSKGRRKGYQVHRLVAQEFLGPKPFPGAVVRHLDGDCMNSAADNLAWGTQSINIQEMHTHSVKRQLQDALAQVAGLEAEVEKLNEQLATVLDINEDLRREVKALKAPYYDLDYEMEVQRELARP